MSYMLFFLILGTYAQKRLQLRAWNLVLANITCRCQSISSLLGSLTSMWLIDYLQVRSSDWMETITKIYFCNGVCLGRVKIIVDTSLTVIFRYLQAVNILHLQVEKLSWEIIFLEVTSSHQHLIDRCFGEQSLNCVGRLAKDVTFIISLAIHPSKMSKGNEAFLRSSHEHTVERFLEKP